jgi:hypothetical protein
MNVGDTLGSKSWRPPFFGTSKIDIFAKSPNKKFFRFGFSSECENSPLGTSETGFESSKKPSFLGEKNSQSWKFWTKKPDIFEKVPHFVPPLAQKKFQKYKLDRPISIPFYKIFTGGGPDFG